jgi:hypothetical protein
MTLTEHLQPMLEHTKRLPAALVAAFLFQIAGVVYWAGAASERIAVLERTAAQNQTAIERVAVLEDRVETMHAQLSRIELKLDQLQDPRVH